MTELLKILFDICFYYTFVGYCLCMFTLERPYEWGIPIIIAAAAVNLLLKKLLPGSVIASDAEVKRVNFRKLLCCALPSVFFAFSPSFWQMIHFLPAWVYFGFIVWTDMVHTDREEFRRRFSFSGKIYLLMALGLFSLSRMKEALTGAIPYFIMYLLSGICVMRILREKGKLKESRNVFILLVMLAGSLGLAVLQTPQLVLTVVGFIYRNIIANVLLGALYAAGAVMYAFAWLFIKLISLFSTKGTEFQQELGAAADEVFGDELNSSVLTSPVWLKYIGFALLALLVAFLIFLILRKMIGARRENESAPPYSEERSPLLKRNRSVASGIFRPREARLIVRWYYRKYLKEAVSRGLRLVPGDTSLAVMDKSGPLFPQSEAKKIRELYILSRYRTAAEIHDIDAFAATELWKKLKQEQPK